MLGWLKLRRIGGQEEQRDVVRHAQFHTGMPSGAVEHQHNLFVRTRAHLTRERRQLDLKERDGDGGGQMEEDAPRGRMDKADHIAPLIAVLDRRDGPMPDWRPDAAQDGLEANAMFIGRPQLDTGPRESRRDGF